MAQVNPREHPCVLVTGATGFVGRVLCARLIELGYPVRCATRTPQPTFPDARCSVVVTGELGPDTDWSNALEGISVVFHLAARTHVLRETAIDAHAEYHRINVAGTRTLAEAAVRAKVYRIVFLSSIKVTGERTQYRLFSEDDVPQPEDAYGISKREAETVLDDVVRGTNTETSILRPPLVYGPGVKGNFLRLLRWTARGVPLPLASIHNQRSLIYVENLVDALITSAFAPAAAGKTYLLSDGEDVSTPGLIRSMAQALSIPARLFPFPPALLASGASLLGKRAEIQRLTGSLQIDSSRIRRELSWSPRFSLAQGLARTAQWYHSQFPLKSNT